MKFLLSGITIFFLFINTVFAAPSYFVVDIDNIINKSVAYVEFKKRWDAVNQQYQKDIETYEQKVDVLDKKLSSNLNNIDEKSLKDSRNLIGGYENRIRQLMQHRTVVLDKAMVDVLDVLKENISIIIQEHAVLHKVNLILSASQVIYRSDNLDITQKILSSLNARLSKVNIEIDSSHAG